MPPQFRIVPSEAGYWWRSNSVIGAVFNRLMIAFILGSVTLVFYRYYLLSFAVFAGMAPYGFMIRRMACWAVRRLIEEKPGRLAEFADNGIVVHD